MNGYPLYPNIADRSLRLREVKGLDKITEMGNDTERTESHTSGCAFVLLIFYTRLPSQDYYNNKVELFFIIIRKYKLYYDNTVK